MRRNKTHTEHNTSQTRSGNRKKVETKWNPLSWNCFIRTSGSALTLVILHSSSSLLETSVQSVAFSFFYLINEWCIFEYLHSASSVKADGSFCTPIHFPCNTIVMCSDFPQPMSFVCHHHTKINAKRHRRRNSWMLMWHRGRAGDVCVLHEM